MFPLHLFLFLLLLVPFSGSSPASQTSQDFVACLFSQNSSSDLIYTPANPNYSTVLQSTIRDARFNTTLTPKPAVIVTPNSLPQIQATLYCSRKHDLHLRLRSGGHDYEGLSYSSQYSGSPFAVLDLVNFRNISVDVPEKTAWVQSGAILGELYYRIAEKSANLSFPAGSCHSVGVGGHFSGGGYGFLTRKYGLAADNVVDAVVIDSRGRILDRASMGEDLFWAIRGGGGNSFGIAVAWKVRLVPVPFTVTVFNIRRTLELNLLKIVHRWQSVANKLPKELVIEIVVSTTNSTATKTKTTIVGIFSAIFQGGSDELLNLMQSRFPELGLGKEDCLEMSWIQAMVFHAGFPSNSSADVLLNRSMNSPLVGSFKYKAKSDYVQNPVPKPALLKVWGKLLETDVGSGGIVMAPLGGRMDEISDSDIPFPHRAGNLYQILYLSYWSDDSMETAARHIGWLRELYNFTAPYVSRNPRSAYVNYRDLDIGTNDLGGEETSYEEAKVWGEKYFGNNFGRLVRVKAAVDPFNFFRNEQSIPVVQSGVSFHP